MWIVIGIICAIIILAIFVLASRQCDNIDDPTFEMGSWVITDRGGKSYDERVFRAAFPEGSLIDDYHVIAVFGRIPPVPYWGINIYRKDRCQGDGVTALSEISPEAGFAVLFGTNLTLIERVRCDIEQHWRRSFREHTLQAISYPLSEEDIYDIHLNWIDIEDIPRLSLRRYQAAHNFPVRRSQRENSRRVRSRHPRESDVIPLEQWNMLYSPLPGGREAVTVAKLKMPHRHATALEGCTTLLPGERLLILVADHGQTSRARISFLKVELDDGQCWIEKTSTDPYPDELRIGIFLYTLGPFEREVNVTVRELLYSEPQTKLGPSLTSILPMKIWKYPPEVPLPEEADKIM